MDWQQFELVPGGSAALSGGIAAVSRIPNSMEVWWVGADGSIQDNFWYDGGQWQRFTLAPPGSASNTGRIAAVSRIPSSMEVWWTGANGSLQDDFWYGDVPATLDFNFDPIVFGGGVPVGGSSHLTIRQDGSYTFSGHFHSSTPAMLPVRSSPARGMMTGASTRAMTPSSPTGGTWPQVRPGRARPTPTWTW